MPKSKITKTHNPIHFEDLEPHRFEDLTRELIYDFKEWQSIEATGRGGSDDGFDIRAYEKTGGAPDSDENEENQELHPMDGNIWMIQCKREKEIGPQKVADIISATVNKKNPPYGYILVAPANFSKTSYDVFRDELRKREVMEFYLWGKAELEDMLHMPRYDRILFTFFGISLASRRRSRSTEIRFSVNNKNKIYKVLGENNGRMYQSVLIRDTNDIQYPYKEKYGDFDKHPCWREYVAYDYHPLGLCLHVNEYYAYIDVSKKEWDFTQAVDLVNRQSEIENRGQEIVEAERKAKDFWNDLPRANQGRYVTDGLIRFDAMAVIDDKGDASHKYPHVFVDFQNTTGPFSGFSYYIKRKYGEIDLKNGYKRVTIFPKKFPESKTGKVHKDKTIVWDDETLRLFKNFERIDTIFDSNGKYSFLNPRDIIAVANPGAAKESSPNFIKITHKFKTKIEQYLKDNPGNGWLREDIERQLGKSPSDDEIIDVYEFKNVYKRDFEPEAK